MAGMGVDVICHEIEYAGTFDWSLILGYTDLKNKPIRISRISRRLELTNLSRIAVDSISGFGCQNILSTLHGLFIGTANPFGPKVVRRVGTEWNRVYEDNPPGRFGNLAGRSHKFTKAHPT